MGIPETDIAMEQARKKQRLSLKANRMKTNASSPEQSSADASNNASPKKASGKESTVSSGCTSSSTSFVTATNSSTTASTDTAISTSASSACSTSTKVDLRVPAVASLENLGNTCFMNSVMQVLRYTPGFLGNLAALYQDIQASEKIKRKNKSSEEEPIVEDDATKTCWKIVKNVYKVYRDLSALEEKYEEVASDDVMSMAVKPNKVLIAIRELNPMYEGHMQHDAQEFLRCLLSYFQDAEKEVQKFYSQLPQKFSPKINPIMQKFLATSRANTETKGKIVKIVEEITSGVSDHPESSVEDISSAEAEKVKCNLFPKAEVKTEAAKSPTKVQQYPKLGDTAGIVDEANEKFTEVGAKTEAKEYLSEIPNDFQCGDKTVQVEAKPQKGRSSARRGRRFKPYDKSKSSSEAGQMEKGRGRGRGSKSNVRVATQPSISDIFSNKTYGNRKRLGMSGAVTRGSAENLFDEMLELEKTVAKQHNSGSVSDSKVCDISEEMASTEESNAASCTELSSTSKANSSNIQSRSSENSSTSSSKVQTPKKNCSREEISPVFSDSQKVLENKSKADQSYQDAFAAFINALHVEDSDSVEMRSDSEDEDIVLKKKLEKQLRESPRRSPRKFASQLTQQSPRKHEVSKLTVGDSKSDSVLLAHAKHKLDFTETGKDTSGESRSQNNNVNQNSVLCLSSMKPEGENTSLETVNSGTEISALSSSSGKDSLSRMPVDLVPIIIKLEKCDHILGENGTSVSAAYATRCLTPVKKRRSLSAGRNYLKERSQQCLMDTSDEQAFKKALLEMLNSPVKSRSKYDLIERTFQGSMMLRTRCLQCESCNERQEEFHDISVPVRIDTADSDDEDDNPVESPQGLLDLIEASTEVERLLEENKYFCGECKAYVEAERSIHYDIMPDILTLHLKRFCSESGNPGMIQKINDHIDIPLVLPCLRYRCSQSCLRPDHRYRLYGMVTHSGYTLTSGHYRAYVRTLPNEPSESALIKLDNSGIRPEPQENNQTTKSKSSKAVPSTRKRMGVVTKLPSRFDDNVVTNTKVKAFESVDAKKTKPDLAASLMPTNRFDSEWFECDDETVRVFDESDFVEMLSEKSGSLLGTPYLLFYHKETIC